MYYKLIGNDELERKRTMLIYCPRNFLGEAEENKTPQSR
jgi:hypothetical protein